MSEEIKKDIEQQPNTQPSDKGDLGNGKMFTQEEVNKIVSERLARDREKRSAQQQDDEKETALKARESRLDCREYLAEKKYPAELLDMLDTTDVEKFKAAADKLQEIYAAHDTRAKFTNPPKFTSPKGGSSDGAPQTTDLIANAFKPKA